MANNLELKIQALREGFRDRIASVTDEYENRIADLRIQITEQSTALDSLASQVREFEEKENKRVQEEASANADSA